MSGPKGETRGFVPHRNTLNKSEVKKLLQKYKKERDEASKKGEISRDKLQMIETATRAQIRELKEKIKTLNSENKSLNKTIKKLQPELQLDANPRLRNKLTREVVKELKERAEQCKNLLQENTRLHQEIDQMASDLAEAENVRKLLEDRLQAAQSQVRNLTNEHDRVLKLWEEATIQRDQTLRINRLFRRFLFNQQKSHQTLDKCIQTIASIPIYRRFQKRNSDAIVKQQELQQQTEKMKQKFVDRVSVIPKENEAAIQQNHRQASTEFPQTENYSLQHREKRRNQFE
ncbi:inner centromere protein A [Heterodontus francisci]|uniref:inner centromere protein A n=1 Tax=Heterodontus francisci TaxID=7792 RepID=UPI00355B6299